MDRILSLKPPDEGFLVCDMVEPLPYGHPSHPEIRAVLSRRGALIVEIEPHIAAALLSNPDGSASLVFHCPLSELEYFVRYFAGLGEDIQVQAPPELRERISAIGRGLVERYPKEKR